MRYRNIGVLAVLIKKSTDLVLKSISNKFTIKDVRSQGGCPVRTFCGQGEGGQFFSILRRSLLWTVSYLNQNEINSPSLLYQ